MKVAVGRNLRPWEARTRERSPFLVDLLDFLLQEENENGVGVEKREQDHWPGAAGKAHMGISVCSFSSLKSNTAS